MTATVLDHVTPKMAIYSEELFGPVVCIIRVNGEEEAIKPPTTASTGCRPRCSRRTSRGR